MNSLCIFCGSRTGLNGTYRQEAEILGKLMAERNIRLVYGGGKVGMMGVIADSVLQHGGHVIGVIPKSLVDLELAHPDANEMIVVDNMHKRKERMYELSDAFLALPGGFGTLDEFCEIFTWFQLGFHEKRIGFLNSDNYFDHLLSHFQHSVDQGFVDQHLYDTIIVENRVEDILPSLVK